MNEDIHALLAVHEYFRGTSDAARRDVLEVGRVRDTSHPATSSTSRRIPSIQSALCSAVV